MKSHRPVCGHLQVAGIAAGDGWCLEALRSKWAGQVGIRATQIAQLFKGDLSCLEGKVSE